jgi:hypothetical protein
LLGRSRAKHSKTTGSDLVGGTFISIMFVQGDVVGAKVYLLHLLFVGRIAACPRRWLLLLLLLLLLVRVHDGGSSGAVVGWEKGGSKMKGPGAEGGRKKVDVRPGVFVGVWRGRTAAASEVTDSSEFRCTTG